MGISAPPPTPTTRKLSYGARTRLKTWAADEARTRKALRAKILEGLAKNADYDGCNAFTAVPTLAAGAHCTERTVTNMLGEMVEYGYLRFDRSPEPPAYARMPGNKRPNRYEILMPASSWSAAELDEINRYRAERGRPPLTAEDRPELAPMPARKTRCDAGVPNPKRRPPHCKLEAGQALEAEAPRGESDTCLGVNEKAAGGESDTPNLVSALPAQDDQEKALPPAVGDQPQVVRGPASPAHAGKIKKAHRAGAPRRRPRELVVSAEAVEVYRAGMPLAIKRYVPNPAAVARILHAITGELEREAGRLGCQDPAEFTRRMVERAEPWLFRMVDARDPVAVIIGAIVRGPDSARTAVPWCGRCEGPTPARRFVTLDDGRVSHCPDCHPSAHHREAAA